MTFALVVAGHSISVNDGFGDAWRSLGYFFEAEPHAAASFFPVRRPTNRLLLVCGRNNYMAYYDYAASVVATHFMTSRAELLKSPFFG